MGNRMNLVGDTYGGLTVLREDSPYISPAGHKNRRWVCLCVCGAEVSVSHCSLRGKRGLHSCGCLMKKQVADRFRTHGMSKSRPYTIWLQMKDRCNDSTSVNYHLYGGKGISYSPDWQSFEGFWRDMSTGYSDDLTLDRINPKDNYCKENCRWASYSQQAKNKSKMKNNTSGVTGVSKKVDRGYEYWVAYYNDEHGKKRNKVFSVRKYGDAVAFDLACKYRRSKIEQLNLEGAGYTEYHGA